MQYSDTYREQTTYEKFRTVLNDTENVNSKKNSFVKSFPKIFERNKSNLPLQNKNNKKFLIQYLLYSQKRIAENKSKKSYLELDYKLKNLLNDIEIFSKFKSGWNGYDAVPFDESVLKKAKDFLIKRFKKLSYSNLEIFPTGRNSVQIEFVNKKNDEMEIEIFKEKYIYLIEFNNSEKEFCYKEEEIFEEEKIEKIIDEFIG